jgi:hypothetical protein
LLKSQISPKEVFIDYRTYPKEEYYKNKLFTIQATIKISAPRGTPEQISRVPEGDDALLLVPEGDDALLLVPEGDDAVFYFLILPANVYCPLSPVVAGNNNTFSRGSIAVKRSRYSVESSQATQTFGPK